MTLCLLLTPECLLLPSLLSQRSSWIMCQDEVGVARLPPQQQNSYLYWYVQKLQEKKSKIIKKMTEKTGWGE